MALIPCPECNAQVSDKAIACPSCGAAPPRPSEPPKSRAWLYALIGVPVIFLVWAMIRTPDPDEIARSNARDAIDFCWEDQKAKSHDPAMARFVAGACEMLERDFRTKYGRNP